MTRKVAANRIVTDSGECLSPGVVEIDHGMVVNVSALHGEQAFTEWMQGRIDVRSVPGGRIALKGDVRLND